MRCACVMAAIMAAIMASACYSPSYTNCTLTCSTSKVCPDGYECDGMLCRSTSSSQTCAEVIGDAALGNSDSRVDGQPGVDEDGDGVDDGVDTCLGLSNPGNYDEDGDGKGDPCDPCPIVSGLATTADDSNDGDTVGDACDPRPNQAGDVIRVFDGFNVPTSAQVLGVWSFDGRAVTDTTTAVNPVANLRWDLGLLAGADVFYISTRIEILDFGTNPSVARIAGTLDGLSGPGVGRGCAVGVNANSQNGMHGVDATAAGDTTLVTAPLTPPTGNGAVHPLRHERTGGPQTIRCVTTNDVDITPSFGSTANSETGMGLHARNVSAAFDYVLIVETPTP